MGDEDRAALLLRFFKKLDFRTIGVTLGVSDDTAQKRVSRALERLRAEFNRRGVTTTALALSTAVSAHAVAVAPAGLAATLSTAALTGATAAIAAQATMNWINLKSIGAMVAAAIAAGTGTHLIQQRQANRLRSENQKLIAEREQLTHERDKTWSTLAANRAEIERLQKTQLELLRLRGEIGPLRRELASQTALANSQPAKPKETSNTMSHPPGSYISKDQVAFAGYATPETALETQIWAMVNGTFDQVTEGMGPAILAEALSDQKSREGFADGQKELAARFKGLQIVAKKLLPDDKVELKWWIDADSGRGQHDEPRFLVQPMVKAGDAWKLGGGTMGHQDDWEKDAQIQVFAP